MDGANKFDCPLIVKSTVKKFLEQKISRKALFLSRDVKNRDLAFHFFALTSFASPSAPMQDRLQPVS